MDEARSATMPSRLSQKSESEEGNVDIHSYRMSWLMGVIKSNSKQIILEDRPTVPGIMVKAASLDALVHLLVNSFMPLGGLEIENDLFPRTMLLMHQWFVSSEELALKLTNLFWHCDTLFTCRPDCLHSFKQVAECQVYRFRTRICQAFRYWIFTFSIHFDTNVELSSIVRDFQRQLHDKNHSELAESVDLSKLPSYDWTRDMSVRNPLAKHSRKVSLVFDHLEAGELAEHLTYLEHKVMRRITFPDFKIYAETSTLQDNPKLERSIALFNGLSQWIQCMVLSRSLPQQRADVIVKFVAVAKKLLHLQNFNSLMAVVGGLSHSALARLTRTMAVVPPETQKSLRELTDLLSSASNFSNYRKALVDSKGFRIPILGVHMKDLISLQVALPDTVENGMINFRKIAQLSLIFQELWELQNSTPSLAVNIDLVNTLRLSLETPYTEDELYELSLTKEPRNSSSPQSSPTKPTVFAEWATESCSPPEPEILEKHINAMVEAVFKNYDTDRDGYISQEEFDAILSNFPFIDAFCVLDVDQDGMISKTEMKKYFLQAKSRTLRTSFQHDFHETTYFRPTFCAHCAGLLWGLIKQGYKCRDCGINAHKHCKDLVVIECRRSTSMSPRSSSFAGTDGVTIKSRFQRHWRKHSKLSQSEGESNLSSPRMSTESCNCENGFISVDPSAGELEESIKYEEVDIADTAELIENSIVSVSRELRLVSPPECRCQQQTIYSQKSSIGSVHTQSSLLSQMNS